MTSGAVKSLAATLGAGGDHLVGVVVQEQRVGAGLGRRLGDHAGELRERHVGAHHQPVSVERVDGHLPVAAVQRVLVGDRPGRADGVR